MFGFKNPPADFFVDTARPDDTGDGLTVATAKKTINAGIALMTGSGQILQIQDGTYTDANDLIEESDLDAGAGTAAAWNTIRAETDGGVVIEHTFGNKNATAGTAVYMRFIGLKWKTPSVTGAEASRKAFRRQYIKFFRCSFSGGRISDNEVGTAGGDSFQLFEDCWFYGYGGRTLFSVYQKTNIILRRCVIRFDSAWGWLSGSSEPISMGTFYPDDTDGAVNLVMQNCVITSGWHNTPPDTSGQGQYGFTFTNNDTVNGTVPTNVLIHGCVWVDNIEPGFEIGGNGNTGYCEVKDCAFLDGSGSGIVIQSGAGDIVADPNPLFKQNLFHGQGWGITTSRASVPNHCDCEQNIIQDSSTGSINNATYMIGDYNNCFNNPSGNCGTNEITTDPMSNGLTYPIRIETGGSLLTAGPGGTRVGPDIEFRIGLPGTLYGESGWDTVTTEKLWPFPNESRIRTDFREITPTAQVTLAAAGFTNFEAGDVGKQLTDDAADAGEIMGFNNTSREVLIKSADFTVPSVADGSTIGVNGGSSGGGTSTGASVQASEAGDRDWCDDDTNDAYGLPHTLTRWIWQKLGGTQVPEDLR